jgi:ribosome-associated protein
MTLIAPTLRDIENELIFTTSRSSGPGGQSVNKVNTKVTLRWDVINAESINDEQRSIILVKLKKVINNEGEVVVAAQSSRSQLQNKEEVHRKLELLLINAFTVKKARKPTKPTKSSNLKRLESKKKQSIKKNLRRGLED